MVVDDSLIIQRKLAKYIDELGHNVVYTADTGEEALKGYAKVKPDLVTMDITMPDMNGVDATRKICKHFPEARIIMVTSHGQEEMVVDALDAGAKGYILKPIKKDKLDATIKRLVTDISGSPI